MIWTFCEVELFVEIYIHVKGKKKKPKLRWHYPLHNILPKLLPWFVQINLEFLMISTFCKVELFVKIYIHIKGGKEKTKPRWHYPLHYILQEKSFKRKAFSQEKLWPQRRSIDLIGFNCIEPIIEDQIGVNRV